ncbi:MAG TPA: isocitrate lyase/PEP mutase family protein [Candidatus Eisenbacteria bacterium]|nr:isocitrate lyase/PEP mutase family protein [Candidatus Eisenbacteria bacterium]
MESATAEKRKALRSMLAGSTIHLAPSCNDGLSARFVEWLGFPLVHISGSGLHRALGFADAGLLTLTEMIERARLISDAVQLPVVSDAETGYGNVVNVVRAVREFERAGVAGIHIEDQMTPKRASHEGFDFGLVSKEEMVAKIKAAVDTRRDESMVIIARSEARHSLEERLERLQACCEVGADAAWVSARSEDEIRAYAQNLNKPLVGVPPRQLMTIQRYGELGVRVGCLPTVLQVAALHAMRQLLQELKDTGTDARYFRETPGIEDTRRWYSELGNKELRDIEARYRF